MQTALNTWLAKLQKARLPALKANLDAAARLSADENVPMDRLAATMEKDPGLSAALMRTIRQIGHKHLRAEVTTVEHALMMLGVDRLKGLPKAVPTVEGIKDELARAQVRALYARNFLAAFLAYEIALLRRDMEPDEVFLAAQLHSLAEVLLWIEAPKKMLEVESHAWHRGMEREEAEYVVLGCSLNDLTRVLAQHWGLPTLVERSLHPEAAENPRIFGLLLAVQLARTATHGWYRPQVAELLTQLAEFLRMDLEELTARLHEAAVEAANRSAVFEVRPAAAWLLMPPGVEIPPDLPFPEPPPRADEAEQPPDQADFCLAPQQPVLEEALRELAARPEGLTAVRVVSVAMEALHDGIGLNRVVFAILTPERNRLHARTIAGSDGDASFNRFAVAVDGVNLFSRLMEKPQALWMNDDNRPRLWAMMPLELYRYTRVNEFYAMSLFVRGKPVGIFYADRHTTACRLTERHYKQFKRVVQEAAAAMTWLAEQRGESRG